MPGQDLIFIHAWWRSGSTYIWSKLRENKSCRCYYEPLNEKIADLNVVDVKASPDLDVSRNLRHPIPTKHYFAEYAKLLRSGNLHYSPSWLISVISFSLGRRTNGSTSISAD